MIKGVLRRARLLRRPAPYSKTSMQPGLLAMTVVVWAYCVRRCLQQQLQVGSFEPFSAAIN